MKNFQSLAIHLQRIFQIILPSKNIFHYPLIKIFYRIQCYFYLFFQIPLKHKSKIYFFCLEPQHLIISLLYEYSHLTNEVSLFSSNNYLLNPISITHSLSLININSINLSLLSIPFLAIFIK